MQTTQSLHAWSRLAVGAALGAFVLVFSACQPIVDPALLEAQQPAAEAAEEPAAVVDVEPAKATVNTRSLRVRQGPGDEFEQIGSIKEGETYSVSGMSSDGAWIQLAVEALEGGSGWVSTEFVTLEGDITNIPTVEVEGAPAATAVPEEEAAPEATAAPAEETEAEATPVAEEEAAPEATPVAEEEAEAEATPVAEEETAPEATPEAEEEAVTPPPAGFALIQAVPPLRVRSAPNADEDNKIGNVFDGEVYPVLEISEDGQWVRIDVPQLGVEDGGWVSAEFVVLGE